MDPLEQMSQQAGPLPKDFDAETAGNDEEVSLLARSSQKAIEQGR